MGVYIKRERETEIDKYPLWNPIGIPIWNPYGISLGSLYGILKESLWNPP